MYQFYEDRTDIADNLIRPWKLDTKGALDVSVNLVGLIEQIYEEAIVEGEEATEIHADKALKSDKYNSYLTQCSHIDKIDLSELSPQELVCFFLNIYQCMYIHCFLKYSNDTNTGDRTISKGFFYNITSYVW